MTGAIEQIRNMSAQIGKEREDKIQAFAPVTQKDFRLRPVPPIEWLFEGFLARPSLVAITGKPGSYKTYFVQWMMQRLSEGLPLLTQMPDGALFGKTGAGRPVRCLCVEEEMDDALLQERMNMMQNGDENMIFWVTESGFTFMDEAMMDALGAFITKENIDVVFFDPFSSVAGMENENDNSEAQKLMKLILDKLVRHGPRVTVVFLHHPSKNSEGSASIRGAGEFLSKSYIQYVLEAEDREGTVSVTCEKNRWKYQSDFRMKFVPNANKSCLFEWTYLGDISKEDKQPDEEKNIREAMLEVLAHGEYKSEEEIIKDAKKWLADRKYRRSLKQLVESRKFQNHNSVFSRV